MKLSKLYCSHENIFKPIIFNEDINIILAEVRLPKDKQKTSHDLGKSLLALVIDFCLLKSIKADFFLIKNYGLFEDFSFFLEVKLNDGLFFTLKRSVKKRSKILIKIHDDFNQDFTNTHKILWDFEGNYNNSLAYVNDILNFDVAKGLAYRKTISYFLRTPNSYNDVFKLEKHFSDSSFKPIIGALMGLSHDTIADKYKIDQGIELLKKIYNDELNKKDQETKEEAILKALLEFKKNELESKDKEYNDFNFTQADIEKPDLLAGKVDSELKSLVNENYYLKSNIENSKKSIKNFDVNLEEIESFYNELNIYFEKQLVRDYNQLIDFSRAITAERNELLEEIIIESNDKFNNNCEKIKELNRQKSQLLEYIKVSESFEKFKILQKEIAELKAEVENINSKIKNTDKTEGVEEQLNSEEEILCKKIKKLKNDLDDIDNNMSYLSIKKHFAYIIKTILEDIGLVDVRLNKYNNYEFDANIIDIGTKKSSSKDKGTTYKKLMCFAFDLAILATYAENNYFKFVYHDGIFDGLDDRQKDNTFNIITEYSKNYKIQYIFTVIEHELPPQISSQQELIKLKLNNTIIKLLHDEGDEGRLFNMESF